MQMNSPTDEEYNNKVKRQWSQKSLHGRHPYDLSQQYVEIETSNKWLTNADLFAEKTDLRIAFRTTHTHVGQPTYEKSPTTWQILPIRGIQINLPWLPQSVYRTNRKDSSTPATKNTTQDGTTTAPPPILHNILQKKPTHLAPWTRSWK